MTFSIPKPLLEEAVKEIDQVSAEMASADCGEIG
jgi:hypothetical protein